MSPDTYAGRAEHNDGRHQRSSVVHVRPMEPRDDARVCEISAACYRHTAEPDGLTRGQVEQAISEWCSPEYIALTRERNAPIIAEVEGRLVGMTSSRGNSVFAMFVDPMWHRRGIGTALFQAVQADIARAGHHRITVKTTDAAVGFYEAMGMTRCGMHVPRRGVFAGRSLIILEKQVGTAPA